MAGLKRKISCPEKEHIEITIAGGLYNVDIYAQTEEELTHGIVYDNKPNDENPEYITATMTVRGIEWEATNTFFCTVGGFATHSGSDATFISSVTVEGFSDEAHEVHTNIWWQ